MPATATTLVAVPVPALPPWPSLAETLLVLAAIALLLPAFATVATLEGRHGRFDPPAALAGDRLAADRTPRDAPAKDLTRKNAAMRALLPSAGTQWAAGMLLALALLKLSRTRMRPAFGVAIGSCAWAAAAWAGQVPWPFAGPTLELGRADGSWTAPPPPFVVGLAALGAVSLAIGALQHTTRRAEVQQTLASRVAFPGFVVATGLGWLLLLDLSARGPAANRYLGLYHHGHLWLALTVLTLGAFLRPAIGRSIATLLAFLDEIGSRVGRSLGPLTTAVALAALVLVVSAAAGLLLSDERQFTSELGRVWLIVGTAWFFYLRGSPAADRLARHAPLVASLVGYTWPLAFVAIVLAAVMIATRDMGPLLIAAYAAGAFLAASVAMWWHIRGGRVTAPAVIAGLLFVAWVAAVTHVVFVFGAFDAVTAGRLENLVAPLASANDQLALVTWFREAVPPWGFGVGAVPWCGFAASGCAGVPAQIQSDYTFTALAGVYGNTLAWVVTIGCALWLHRLVRHHGKVTSGEPRFVRTGGRTVADRQAFLSWIGVTWVVLTLCQLAVTVAGNLAVLPLTGVTFPFVSFGMTSLVVNAALLALCLNVDRPGIVHG